MTIKKTINCKALLITTVDTMILDIKNKRIIHIGGHVSLKKVIKYLLNRKNVAEKERKYNEDCPLVISVPH